MERSRQTIGETALDYDESGNWVNCPTSQHFSYSIVTAFNPAFCTTGLWDSEARTVLFILIITVMSAGTQ